jgi:hypothetical protein
MIDLLNVVYNWRLMTGERLLCYPRRTKTEIIANILLAVLFVCSFQRSFRSNIIPRYFTFVDQGTEWLNRGNSDRCLCERRVKSIASISVALCKFYRFLHFVNHCARSDM